MEFYTSFYLEKWDRVDEIPEDIEIKYKRGEA
jgi:hypothetical protein